MHVGSILMSPGVSVGKHCSFHINTALVAGGTNDDAPIIGDYCVLGIGAVVVGGCSLADHIAVGGNALVNKTFCESDIAIAGVPAKKISNNGRSAWGKHSKK